MICLINPSMVMCGLGILSPVLLLLLWKDRHPAASDTSLTFLLYGKCHLPGASALHERLKTWLEALFRQSFRELKWEQVLSAPRWSWEGFCPHLDVSLGSGSELWVGWARAVWQSWKRGCCFSEKGCQTSILRKNINSDKTLSALSTQRTLIRVGFSAWIKAW